MARFFKKISASFRENILPVTLILAASFSLASFLFFYLDGQQNTTYFDAQSHLNMSRKIVDNLNPGLGQLGGLWLPLLHLLMVPFIWSDFMWRSGWAGACVSMPAFVLSVYFVFKTVEFLFRDRTAAFLGALVYMASMNMLLLQSMAMMEPLFNLTIIGSIYYLSRWARTDNLADLSIGAFFVFLSTLTRYEGYAVLAASAAAVLIVTFIKNFNARHWYRIVEGKFLIFMTLASFGVLLWLAYSLVIFGDPLHWTHPNTRDVSAVIETVQDGNPAGLLRGDPTDYYRHDLSRALLTFWWTAAIGNGLIVFLAGIIGFLSLLWFCVKNSRYAYLFIPAVLISVAFPLFIIALMYFGQVSLLPPFLGFTGIFDKGNNLADEAGIRYTLAMLPFVAIFMGWLAAGGAYRKITILLLIVFQTGSFFFGPLFLTYDLSLKWKGVYGQENRSVEWFKKNYSGGLILESALSHEAEMFQNGLAYKNYIHEGTGHYWEESLKNPVRYATWIIMNKSAKTDTSGIWGQDILTDKFRDSKILRNNFNLVYDDGKILIYKIKSGKDLLRS
ncbi:MAG: glycosyltransferase family 39 protein [Candidatus Moranbacteria bacterium]|nr:glycosyltransferase family 39 protein [Candidatus Moranbacteria bacterium]